MADEAVVIKDEVFDMCVPQEKWEPDEKCNSCTNCNKPFSLFRRRVKNKNTQKATLTALVFPLYFTSIFYSTIVDSVGGFSATSASLHS